MTYQKSSEPHKVVIDPAMFRVDILRVENGLAVIQIVAVYEGQPIAESPKIGMRPRPSGFIFVEGVGPNVFVAPVECDPGLTTGALG